MARRSVFAIEYDGPFFERDPTKTFRKNVRRLMERMATVGEAEVKRRIAQAPRRTAGPSYSGRFIRGRVKSLAGRPWATTMVVSADVSSLDGPGARRVQAALAGRRNSVGRDGRNRGTTRGHEGTAKVYSRTATGLRRLGTAAGKELVEGVA